MPAYHSTLSLKICCLPEQLCLTADPAKEGPQCRLIRSNRPDVNYRLRDQLLIVEPRAALGAPAQLNYRKRSFVGILQFTGENISFNNFKRSVVSTFARCFNVEICQEIPIMQIYVKFLMKHSASRPSSCTAHLNTILQKYTQHK